MYVIRWGRLASLPEYAIALCGGALFLSGFVGLLIKDPPYELDHVKYLSLGEMLRSPAAAMVAREAQSTGTDKYNQFIDAARCAKRILRQVLAFDFGFLKTAKRSRGRLSFQKMRARSPYRDEQMRVFPYWPQAAPGTVMIVSMANVWPQVKYPFPIWARFFKRLTGFEFAVRPK